MRDYLSKFTVVAPLKKAESTEVAIEIFKIMMTFGFCQVVIHDNGTEFVNAYKDAFFSRFFSPVCPLKSYSSNKTLLIFLLHRFRGLQQPLASLF